MVAAAGIRLNQEKRQSIPFLCPYDILLEFDSHNSRRQLEQICAMGLPSICDTIYRGGLRPPSGLDDSG